MDYSKQLKVRFKTTHLNSKMPKLNRLERIQVIAKAWVESNNILKPDFHTTNKAK